MSDLPSHLARYASVMDDFKAFSASLTRPLPQTLAVNPLRTSVTELVRLLGQDYALEPISWRPGALRLAPQDRPGRSWAFTAGLFTLQEEASLLPAWLLDVRPGHRVLDLCAAPGNKTTHLALGLENRGTLIANELKRQRLTALHDVCRRLGLTNVSTCAYDGLQFPQLIAGFDRILVDAPCSSEGKAQRGYLRASDPGFRQYIRRQQQGLLKRAFQLCRPGGRIVYSTCTFAPEENEAIVSEVLDWAEGSLRVMPVAGAIPNASPGLQQFEGQDFHPDLDRALRLWPHLSGTGGFFAVLLERSLQPDTAATDSTPSPVAGPPADDPRLRQCLDHFGIPLPDGNHFRLGETLRHLKLISVDHQPPEELALENQGLELARLRDGRAQLSTSGAMALGGSAQRQVVTLDAAQRECWRRRETQALTADQAGACQPGLVLVHSTGHTLGSALLRQTENGTWSLESQFPKAWAPVTSKKNK